MKNRAEQIKYYKDILKDGEILLLKSSDTFFKVHYDNSPLNVLTNFQGSAGEGIIDKDGNIKIFVDSRYHILVEKQVFDDIETVKIPFGESFFDCLKKMYKKGTILYLEDEIPLKTYFNYDKYFDLRTYHLKKSYLKNKDFNKNSAPYKIKSSMEKIYFIKKVEKLKKVYKNISKIVIFDLDIISYLTNLRSFQMRYSSNFKSILFLDLKNNKHTLFCDEINPKTKIEGLDYLKIDDFSNFIKSINEEIYVNYDDITLKNYLLIKNPKQLKNNVLPLNASIKTKTNIIEIQRCFEKTDIALFNFKKRLKTNLSEYDLANIFKEEIISQGAKDLSFKTILAINSNSASIHYSTPSKDVLLKDESLVLIDCGAYFESGFATDITRTMYFGKTPKPIHKKIYTNVLKAFLLCYMTKENDAKKLDKIARDNLKQFEKEGFYFAHGLGHGIGTSVHQNPPLLSMNSKDIIKPYQTHSIEPGLYGKDIITGLEFGVRIENCVFCDIDYQKHTLSNFPFEEVLIDYSLLDNKEKEIVKIWQGKFDE